MDLKTPNTTGYKQKKGRKSHQVFYYTFSNDLLCILIFSFQITFSLAFITEALTDAVFHAK